MRRDGPSTRTTFGYEPHALAGGKTNPPVTLSPKIRKAPAFANPKVLTAQDGLISPPAPPEGRYVTRDTGKVDGVSLLMIKARERKYGTVTKPEPTTLPTEVWLVWCESIQRPTLALVARKALPAGA